LLISNICLLVSPKQNLQLDANLIKIHGLYCAAAGCNISGSAHLWFSGPRYVRYVMRAHWHVSRWLMMRVNTI